MRKTNDVGRFVYLNNPGHNPGPGTQNTAKLVFVLLGSAETENTCSRSDVAGYHMMHHGPGQSDWAHWEKNSDLDI